MTRLAQLLALTASALLVLSAQAQNPRNGGELVFPVPSEPPSYDGHREETFGLIHPIAPFYNTLLRVDPNDPSGTKPAASLAESWTVSKDGLTYTFKLRRGVKFHDGSEMTSKDVKASYDKIIFPPPGIGSTRKGQYADVAAVEAPDPYTVSFRLKAPSASFVSSMSSPWNFIYKADILAKDMFWYEKNIMGTGPFTFVEHVKGSHMVGKKNPNYWDKGKPYLEGFRAIFMRDSAAQVAAIRGERAHIQFRGFSPAERDSIVSTLKDRVTVQESPWDCILMVGINHEKKPFDDKRVRRALTLALDRHQASQSLSKIAIVKAVAGVQVPGTPFATPPQELNKLAGYWTDIEKAGGDRGCRVFRRHPQGRHAGAHGLPVRLHRRARSGHVQVPVQRPQSGELRALQGPGARRAVRQAGPRDQSRGAQAAHPPVREAAARRGGALPDDAAVAPHHPPLREGQGVDDYAEPLPQQHAGRGLARQRLTGLAPAAAAPPA